MHETLGYRVKRERVMANLTQDELATRLNDLGGSESKINRGMVSKWENNKETPSLDNLRRLCKFFERPMDYFAISDDIELDGLGSALKNNREHLKLSTAEVAEEICVYESDLIRYEDGDPVSSTIVTDFAERIALTGYYNFLNDNCLYDDYIPPIFDGDADQYEKFKKAVDDDARKEAQIFRQRATRQIPVLGPIAAGAPILAEENIESYIEINLAVKADFALRIQGDSMIDANIYDGDIVFIRQQPAVENGEIAAVMLIDPDTSDARATLKRVYKTDEGMTLVAENKAYPPIVVNKDTYDGAKILGKAVKCITDVR